MSFNAMVMYHNLKFRPQRIIMSVCACFFVFIASVSLYAVPTQAAEFLSDNSVNTDRVYTNLYATGNDITIDNDIQKDLVAAGSIITISSNVERNANLVGATVVIKPNAEIGANARIGANSIIIEGVIGEDAVLAGDSITLRDATIVGDLVVAANELIIENSLVSGNAYISVTTFDTNALNLQVEGEVITSNPQVRVNEDELSRAGSAFAAFVRTVAFISSLIFSALSLIVLGLFLRARNRLEIPSITISKKRLIEVGIGILSFGVVFIAFMISILVPWIGIPVALITIAIMLLSNVFLPIYLGNALKKLYFKELSVEGHIAISWVLLACIDFVTYILSFAGLPGSVVGFILGLCINILYFGALGFLLTKIFNMFNSYLAKR